MFTELLDEDETKYVKLMMGYISNRKWLTKTDGPLVSLRVSNAQILKYGTSNVGFALQIWYGKTVLFGLAGVDRTSQ